MVYTKNGTISTIKYDDTWEEIDDELVETPYGAMLKSYVESEEYKDFLKIQELDKLRLRRERECFSVINQNFIIDGKSVTWFDTLTEEQKTEASIWVHSWRDVTDTLVVPDKPSWLK